MRYRPEIDGLRAVAVMPVIFFHAGFELFSGGFVGVDIFFVISGYLITTILVSELERNNFSIVNFYERRARRILPALFVVMLSSLTAGYFLLMPDEFKNLGQSLVATIFFSNNILLALTSGYWDLASEFKPLLHTWSLGVEEQYYVVIPFLLLLIWRFNKAKINFFLWSVFFISFIFSVWLANKSPNWTFYGLPTRAWEIALGGLAALYFRSHSNISLNLASSNFISSLGLILVIFSIFTFSGSEYSSSYYVLLPTVGACLIILFSVNGTWVHRLLGSRAVVFVGLLSYSLYLWHQPVFAFLRIYSKSHPSSFYFFAATSFVFLLSFISWKFVESPFRNKSFVSRKGIFISLSMGSVFFVAVGLYLNKSYGIPERVFDSGIRMEDMDKRIYNEKAFLFKKTTFSSDPRKKLLIIGNSFGRDFVNITLEYFNTKNFEIIYRDDLNECIFPYQNLVSSGLYSKSDVIVFASGGFKPKCLLSDLDYAKLNGKIIFYVGTKSFGYNLNWLIRYSGDARRNKYNVIDDRFIGVDLEMSKMIPSGNFISLLAPTVVDNAIPITDDRGRMLSTDRAHLTKYGAIYFGEKAVVNTEYSKLFN